MKTTIRANEVELEAETQHEKDALRRIENYHSVTVRSGGDRWTKTDTVSIIVELPNLDWGT